MDEDNKVNKDKKFSIKELIYNKRYRSILILFFYAIVFIVLISLLNSNRSNVGDKSNNYSVLEGFDLIYNNNFAYKYTVTLDDKIIVYDGKKNNNREVLLVSDSVNEKSYYINGNDVFIKEDNNYIKSNKPYFVFDFFDTKIIEALMRRCNTQNEEYYIDNQSLNDVLSDYDRKVDSGKNNVLIEYRNNYITKISFDLSNYVKITTNDYDNVTITLEYYDFNLIDEIDDLL